MDSLTISLTMWGNLRDDYKWLEWYADMKKLFQMFELNITHLGATGSQYPKKVVTVARKEKEILKKIEDGNPLTDFSCYSLPKDYKAAVFDYNLLIYRESSLITLIAGKEYYEDKKIDSCIAVFNKYIDMNRGQIYEMDRKDTPWLFAFGENDISFYKSLRVIKDSAYVGLPDGGDFWCEH